MGRHLISMPPILDIRNLVKSYDGVPALRGVNLQVEPGAAVALLGPSGCGKTTLLRIVAGLEQADAGSVLFEGRAIDGVPTHQRGFGLMFQEYALFPHRTVAENVAFGLNMQNVERRAARARVGELLELVGLAGYGARRVDELSGGERQRVALARSLAPRPHLLMLDEPLGALDRTLRERLLGELHSILRQVGVTTLYVTHDQAEAFAIADWLVLMNAGQIEQQGQPAAVYRHPATLFAARFLGHTNIVSGTVLSSPTPALVETVWGKLRVADATLAPGTPVVLTIRPEAVRPALPTDHENRVEGVVTAVLFRGGRSRVVLHTSAAPLVVELDSTDTPVVGETYVVVIRPDGISVIMNSL